MMQEEARRHGRADSGPRRVVSSCGELPCDALDLWLLDLPSSLHLSPQHRGCRVLTDRGGQRWLVCEGGTSSKLGQSAPSLRFWTMGPEKERVHLPTGEKWEYLS